MDKRVLEIEGYHTVSGFYKENSSRYMTVVWLEIGRWERLSTEQFYQRAALADDEVGSHPCTILDSSMISFS